MRSLLIVLACGRVVGQLTSTPEDIAIGLVEGFLIDGPVKQCIVGSKITFQDLDQAIKDFEKKDATDVLNGIRELGDSLKQFPVALRNCKAAEADVDRVVNALKQFHSPWQFAYHVGKNLFVNRHDISHEVQSAVAAYENKNYQEFGLQIGEALRSLVVGVEGKFIEFMVKHNKTYSSPEETQNRMKAFTDNFEHIYHLQRSESGTAVYSYLSPFADMTPEEFSARNGFRPQDASDAPLAETLDVSDAPDSWDWVAKGAVNAIKNQAQCGSCWAFATVANIEGAGFVENGKLVSLSEQELVDCDKATGDQGCQGGLPSNAYKDMIQKKLGLETESNYPYVARNGQCKAVASKEVAFITAYQSISKDEDQIAAALVKYGPLAIGINAGPMQWYHGGVANPWSILCNPKSLDHGVAIVGYGVDGSKKYWKIRNSWGVSWGEKGYYRIIRGTGKCGLNTMVATATGIKFHSAQNRDVVV